MFEHVVDNCNCPGKWCSNCGQVKCRGAFNRNQSQKDGLDNYCRICKSAWRAAYQQGSLDLLREQRERAKSSATYRYKGTIPVFDHIDSSCNCPGKLCSSCEQIKCYGAFNSLKKARSGLQPYCRACQSAIYEIYYQNNLERERARHKNEEKREYGRAWRRANPEYMQQYSTEYREANAERIRANRGKYKEQDRAYAQSHLKERAIYEKNRHARKLQAEGTFTRREWEALCQYYDYTCLRCGKQEPDIELTVDHVIPLSMGGSNSIDNIQLLCHSCNARKHKKTVDYSKEWESRN